LDGNDSGSKRVSERRRDRLVLDSPTALGLRYEIRATRPSIHEPAWDFEDDQQVRRRLPRLAALFLD